MSTGQTENAVPASPCFVQNLMMIFGTNKTIQAEYRPDGVIVFSDVADTNNTWETALPENVEWFEPGIYRIDIKEKSFDFALACDQ